MEIISKDRIGTYLMGILKKGNYIKLTEHVPFHGWADGYRTLKYEVTIKLEDGKIYFYEKEFKFLETKERKNSRIYFNDFAVEYLRVVYKLLIKGKFTF